MPNPLHSHTHFYIVGIKGVAMATMAQLLHDAGKSVRGADVAETFVTQKSVEELGIQIDEGFTHDLPESTECVIYTAAHGASANPLVTQAQGKNIPTFTHAEALSWFFNDVTGIAVCGVGGKTTISAMITWILEKLGAQPSYSVGVGSIPGLDRPGKWRSQSNVCVVEADEYATDPTAVKRGEATVPRFHYLKPSIIVSTNIRFDHPDVYSDVEHTKRTFAQFFDQRKPKGTLIFTADDSLAVELAGQARSPKFGVGTHESAEYQLSDISHDSEWSYATLSKGQEVAQIKLTVPGVYNLRNAAAAIAAVHQLGYTLAESADALQGFRSTQRRFEFKGSKNGVRFFDDYAHHPHELQAVISTALDWFDPAHTVIAFQPHTFSRTRELFDEFVLALSRVPHLVLLDIFASARESFATDITSAMLATAVQQKAPQNTIITLSDEKSLEEYLKTKLPADTTTVITLGAGTIYKAVEKWLA